MFSRIISRNTLLLVMKSGTTMQVHIMHAHAKYERNPPYHHGATSGIQFFKTRKFSNFHFISWGVYTLSGYLLGIERCFPVHFYVLYKIRVWLSWFSHTDTGYPWQALGCEFLDFHVWTDVAQVQLNLFGPYLEHRSAFIWSTWLPETVRIDAAVVELFQEKVSFGVLQNVFKRLQTISFSLNTYANHIQMF